MLNSNTQSCFYHGLTDFHKESWFAYLEQTQPFAAAVVNSGEINKQQMTSIDLLQENNLLMPFENDRYNASWGGLAPTLL